MAEQKTQPTDASVEGFIAEVSHPVRRQDASQLLAIMKDATGEQPVMWGDSIIGFGEYHYRNTQGGGHWLMMGFSPRKQNLALYIMLGVANYPQYLDKLGKHKHSVSCLYINRLSDVDVDVLKQLVERAYMDMKTKYSA